MLRSRTFSGGIDLPDEKEATLGAAIEPASAVERLRVPLGGAVAAAFAARHTAPKPSVSVGQAVTAGQMIAKAQDPDGLGVDVFTPVDGVVASVGEALVAGLDGNVSAPAIEIEPTCGRDARETLAQDALATQEWDAASPEELRKRLRGGGLTTCRWQRSEAGFAITSLPAWVERARARKCGTLILNVMESQPYVTADHRLLAEQGGDVLRGLAILARAMDIREVLLAVDRRRADAYRTIVGPSKRYGISRVALSHKYPMGNDIMVAMILTGKETPPGGSPLDVGVAVVHAQACWLAYRWVAAGLPVTHRVVTVSGPNAAKPGNFLVPLGMNCLELAGRPKGLVIHGGPMNGQPCDGQTVVTTATEAVLALGERHVDPPGPCIRCGWCTDHCPARLNVAELNDLYELGQVERARKIGVMASLECGVCSYVCPARLPLTQRVKQLKRAIRTAGRRS